MCFCDEVICVDTCSKHCSDISYLGRGLDSCCENNHICFNLELLVFEKVHAVNGKLSIRLGSNLTYLALNVVYAVFLDCSSVEFVEPPGGRLITRPLSFRDSRAVVIGFGYHDLLGRRLITHRISCCSVQ